MEYRKMPRGVRGEQFGTLGLGLGGIEKVSEEEIEKTVRKAIEFGINFFDLCGGGAKVYAPVGRAIAGQREKVYFQLHFGAVYNEEGAYGCSRDLKRVEETFEWELKELGTDYADFGFIHCVDTDKGYGNVMKNGIFDFAKEQKAKGLVRYLGFSSHTPEMAHRLLDTGVMDMMMFSINPAYDLEQGDELGIGTVSERAELFRRCEKEGVGISVMKPFHGGKILDAKTSPFKKELTKFQCIQYALDRPGVLTVVPGPQNYSELLELLEFDGAGPEERDYSVIGMFTPESAEGSCVYCNHCQPCPQNINIGLVNKYYDLAAAGDKMAAEHYGELPVKAGACIECGHCDEACPFHVKQQDKMKKISEYFGR